MSLQSAPYYWVTCDYPGCGERPEYGEYSAMADEGSARDGWGYLDEWVLGGGPGEDEDYCPAHTAYDDDSGELVPLPLVTA